MAKRERPFSIPSQRKKRAFQAEIKKQLILKVANEVFAEKGYDQTTISQIARKANIAEGSIYDYFKNKEDLLFSIPEERMENFLSGLRAHLKGIKGALPKLRKLIWYHLDFYEKNQDYTRILLLDLRQNPRFDQSKAYGKIRQYSKVILEIIEEGKKENGIRKEVDPYLFRDLVLGTIEHFSIRGFIMGRLPSLAAASEDLYDLVISGVENKKPMITLPLEELKKIQLPRMAQPIPYAAQASRK